MTRIELQCVACGSGRRWLGHCTLLISVLFAIAELSVMTGLLGRLRRKRKELQGLYNARVTAFQSRRHAYHRDMQDCSNGGKADRVMDSSGY